MKISDEGLTLIKINEGLRLRAYQDSKGIWTIGFGTIKMNGVPVKEGDVITESIAYDLMRYDIKWVEDCINQEVAVPLSQPMFDALCSFVYNIGCSQFASSTLLRLLNLAQYKEAAGQFERWKYAGSKQEIGLIKRREREREMFLREIPTLRYPPFGRKL